MRIISTIHFLSLDVVVGGVISGLFLAQSFKVSISPIDYLLLALVIWCIYTADHLLDALKLTHSKKIDSARHDFYRANFKKLAIVLIIGLVAIVVMLFFISYGLLLFGSALGGLVIVYFITVHLLEWKKAMHKELTISILYTIGIALPTLSKLTAWPNLNQWNLLLIFNLLAFLNLLLFSLYDYKLDKRANFPSLTQILGVKNTKRLYEMASLICLAVLLLGTFLFDLKLFWLFISMFLILQILYWFSSKRFILANYRYFADGIFLLPMLVIV